MNITEITVHASTSFNHPHESYANFKPGVSITAVLAEGENHYDAVETLQRYAHEALSEEKKRILKRVDIGQKIENTEDRIARLTELIEETTAEIASETKIIEAKWEGTPLKIEGDLLSDVLPVKSEEELKDLQADSERSRTEKQSSLAGYDVALKNATSELLGLEEKLAWLL